MKIMLFAVLCPECEYHIPEDSSYCPRCGRKVTTLQKSSSSTDFPIWEGNLINIRHQQAQERISQPHSTLRSQEEVCKCLGTIDGMMCGTYYFASSVKRNGGCARRDCRNSFENGPKIVMDWGNKKRIEHEESYTFLRAIIGLLGLFLLILGIAEEPVSVLIGILLIFGAIIPFKSTKYEYEEVTFQLVRRSEIPKNAIDPWTQKSILD